MPKNYQKNKKNSKLMNLKISVPNQAQDTKDAKYVN